MNFNNEFGVQEDITSFYFCEDGKNLRKNYKLNFKEINLK